MDYGIYRRRTERAARATGGTVTSLAGGYYGVSIALDGTRAVVCMDLDGAAGESGRWLAWAEAPDGETCCDHAARDLPRVSPTELHTLTDHAARVILEHARTH